MTQKRRYGTGVTFRRAEAFGVSWMDNCCGCQEHGEIVSFSELYISCEGTLLKVGMSVGPPCP